MPLYSLLFFVQIVSESFPISSSGHVALLECIAFYYENSGLLHGYMQGMQDSVMHMLHIPTVFIVAFFFRQDWVYLLLSMRKTWPILLRMIWYTLMADIITACFYLIKKQCTFLFPLYIGFFITALILYSLRFVSSKRKSVSLRTMAMLGCAQGVALLLPGVSRFATVYASARWMGIAPHKAFSITWMIQWPLIAAAAIASLRHEEVWYFLMNNNILLLMGCASLGALVGMYIVYVMAMRERLWLFSIYMMLPIIVSWWFCA